VLSPSSADKTEAATAVVVAPDDGHEVTLKYVELYLNDK
jgi:hypothetical protein